MCRHSTEGWWARLTAHQCKPQEAIAPNKSTASESPRIITYSRSRIKFNISMRSWIGGSVMTLGLYSQEKKRLRWVRWRSSHPLKKKRDQGNKKTNSGSWCGCGFSHLEACCARYRYSSITTIISNKLNSKDRKVLRSRTTFWGTRHKSAAWRPRICLKTTCLTKRSTIKETKISKLSVLSTLKPMTPLLNLNQ